MLEVHISKHSLFRLKITVGCLVCGVVCVVLCCVVLWCGSVVWCVVKLGTHSLLFSLLPLLFPFLFSLLSFFFSLLFLFLLLLLLLVLSLSLVSSFFPSTHSSLLIPSHQQTLYKALINKHGVQL